MLDIAILEGCRTPFAKAFGALAAVPPDELGRIAAEAVLSRAQVKPADIDQVVFGNVATPADTANIARVIALRAGIPQDRIAHTVQRNCASGMEAITTAAQLIQLGEAKVVLAGGTESMSRIPLLYNPEATALFMKLGRAKSFWQRVKALLQFRLRHFKPVIAVQQGLTDPVSGLIMGATAEILAEEFEVSRLQQDEFALASHQRATSAQKQGRLQPEIVAVPEQVAGHAVVEDIGPRQDQSLAALAKLKPFFKEGGTVTVGNSCSLTDGAAAVVLMAGEQARSEGRKPLGYVRAYAYAGCDPSRMGLGPAYATSKVLDRTGLAMKDMDLIEMNEAFAAQVLANEKAFASDEFARKELKRDHRLGEIDSLKLNVNGGAIALGHPVGATGTRLIITLLKELHRRGLKRGLATLCVGGGQGGAVVVETE